MGVSTAHDYHDYRRLTQLWIRLTTIRGSDFLSRLSGLSRLSRLCWHYVWSSPTRLKKARFLARFWALFPLLQRTRAYHVGYTRSRAYHNSGPPAVAAADPRIYNRPRYIAVKPLGGRYCVKTSRGYVYTKNKNVA